MSVLTWEREIFSGALSQEIQIQYKKLLSVGMTAEQAEATIVTYFINSAACDSWEQGSLWLALSLTEWKLGRLSKNVYDMAIKWLDCPSIPISKQVVHILIETLNAPMPAEKRIPLAKVRHCPWPEGSLLAYKIASNYECSQSLYWNKYVLLRVVAVKKNPVTYLAPSMRYSESMLVALYQWVGDAIPNYSIADNLEFTPIRILNAPLSKSALQKALDLVGQEQSLPKDFKQKLTSPRKDYYYLLDWSGMKSGKGEITVLDCNLDFKEQLPESIRLDTMGYVLSNLQAFDMRLTKRMEELFG